MEYTIENTHLPFGVEELNNQTYLKCLINENDVQHMVLKNEIETIERDFNIGYIHSTTATEGNTCTLAEVTRILDDSLSPKGKSLREI